MIRLKLTQTKDLYFKDVWFPSQSHTKKRLIASIDKTWQKEEYDLFKENEGYHMW